ncbi:hypothetical protein TeGR_g11426, partial [Tetraparma gracilis]
MPRPPPVPAPSSLTFSSSLSSPGDKRFLKALIQRTAQRKGPAQLLGLYRAARDDLRGQGRPPLGPVPLAALAVRLGQVRGQAPRGGERGRHREPLCETTTATLEELHGALLGALEARADRTPAATLVGLLHALPPPASDPNVPKIISLISRLAPSLLTSLHVSRDTALAASLASGLSHPSASRSRRNLLPLLPALERPAAARWLADEAEPHELGSLLSCFSKAGLELPALLGSLAADPDFPRGRFERRPGGDVAAAQLAGALAGWSRHRLRVFPEGGAARRLAGYSLNLYTDLTRRGGRRMAGRVTNVAECLAAYSCREGGGWDERGRRSVAQLFAKIERDSGKLADGFRKEYSGGKGAMGLSRLVAAGTQCQLDLSGGLGARIEEEPGWIVDGCLRNRLMERGPQVCGGLQ